MGKKKYIKKLGGSLKDSPHKRRIVPLMVRLGKLK